MLQLTTLLPMFLFLLVASLLYSFTSKKKIPLSPMLVVVGIGIGLLGRLFPELSFVSGLELTPEILFYFFLPVLIFESSYAMHPRTIFKNIASIFSLATFGLMLSTAIIGLATHYIFGLLELPLPLIVCLIFGSVISATDPIAVIALAKEGGLPKRLKYIFEGESLFNDGTALAVFLILFGVAEYGFHGFKTVGLGLLGFFIMLVGGVVFGYVLGRMFSFLFKKLHGQDTVILTLMLVLAHIVFLGTELFNELMPESLSFIALSPIIATVTASLTLSTHGKVHLVDNVRHYFEQFWEHVTFVVNALIFIMLGLLLVSHGILTPVMMVFMVVGAIVTTLTRFIATFTSLRIVEFFALERPVPKNWKSFLSWGGIRGALSVILILMIPESFTVTGWQFDLPVRDVLFGLTLGSMFLSLVGKGPFLIKVLKKLGIDKPDIATETEAIYLQKLIAEKKKEKLSQMEEKGYLPSSIAEVLHKEVSEEISKKITNLEELHTTIERYVFAIEKNTINDLYERGEINEALHLILLSELEEEIEEYLDEKGKDKMVRYFEQYEKKTRGTKVLDIDIVNKFLYLRARKIIAQKAIKELKRATFLKKYEDVVQPHIDAYLERRNMYNDRMMQCLEENKDMIGSKLRELGELMMSSVAKKEIEKYCHLGFISESSKELLERK